MKHSCPSAFCSDCLTSAFSSFILPRSLFSLMRIAILSSEAVPFAKTGGNTRGLKEVRQGLKDVLGILSARR